MCGKVATQDAYLDGEKSRRIFRQPRRNFVHLCKLLRFYDNCVTILTKRRKIFIERGFRAKGGDFRFANFMVLLLRGMK